jgi:hypothetical protein
MQYETKKKLITWLENGQVELALNFIKQLEVSNIGQISGAQRGAIHLYLSQVAHEANNQGLTLQDMIKVVKKLEIRPNTNNLKETFLKPYIESAFGLKSSEKMTSQQIDETYDALNKLFSFYWHISLPFPSEGPEQSVAMTQVNNRNREDYPEYNEAPTI